MPRSARCSTQTGGFTTRDLALLDADGYLFVGGRSDDTIIRGGENIAPAELEEVLIEHSPVRDVAVVGVDDQQWGQMIVAVVVPAVGDRPRHRGLRVRVRKISAGRVRRIGSCFATSCQFRRPARSFAGKS